MAILAGEKEVPYGAVRPSHIKGRKLLQRNPCSLLMDREMEIIRKERYGERMQMIERIAVREVIGEDLIAYINGNGKLLHVLAPEGIRECLTVSVLASGELPFP